MATQTAGEGSKWFDSLPTPKSDPGQIGVEELHSIQAGGENVLVVDVRRADIEVGLSHMDGC
jgi:hypothetical protein